MVNKQLREERHHGDISLPVSGYRVQPPLFPPTWGSWNATGTGEMELFQVERGTMQVQCGSEYFEAQGRGTWCSSTAGSSTPPSPSTARSWTSPRWVFSPELLCGDENDIVRRRYVAPGGGGASCSCPRVTDSSTPAGRQVVGAFQQVMDLLERRPPAYELRVRAQLLEVFAGLAGSAAQRAPPAGERPGPGHQGGH